MITKFQRLFLVNLVAVAILLGSFALVIELVSGRGPTAVSAATNDTAFVYLLTDVSASGTGSVNMTWRVLFAGPSIPGGQDFSEVTVAIVPGDSPVVLRQKI